MGDNDLYAMAAHYGVQYSGTLVDGTYHDQVDHSRTYSLAEVKGAGGKITRVRILAERRGRESFGDVSYVHATLPDGKIVPVRHPGQIQNVPRKFAWAIEWAKEEGVFAKGIGLLEEGNWSVMW